MGIFSKKGLCSICGKEKGKEISDGFVCKDCELRCGMFITKLGDNKSLGRVQDYTKLIEKNKEYLKIQEERKAIFKPNKEIGGIMFVDEEHGLWSWGSGMFKKKPEGPIYHIYEIVSYYIVEDGDVISRGTVNSSHAAGTKIVINHGSSSKQNCSQLDLCINTTLIPVPARMRMIQSTTKTSSLVYRNSHRQLKDAENFLAGVKLQICNEQLKKVKVTVSTKSAEQPKQADDSLAKIKQLKELLDMGAITEEEFNTKKKELLNL